MRVAERWATLLGGGSLDDAMLLYSPTATLRAGGEVLLGPTRIRAYLAASGLLGTSVPSAVEAEDGTIQVRWDAVGPDGEPAECHMVVAHGEIVEQWLGAVPDTPIGPSKLMPRRRPGQAGRTRGPVTHPRPSRSWTSCPLGGRYYKTRQHVDTKVAKTIGSNIAGLLTVSHTSTRSTVRRWRPCCSV